MELSNLKSKAITLRKRGLSYGEIRKKLGIPKSTLSYWLKNIPLPQKYKKRLYTKRILILTRGIQSQKERRKREIEKIIENAQKEIQLPLSFKTYKIIGAFLYWAEGSKTKGFEIANSDPALILFMVKWLERVFKISPKKLKAKLNIYSQQDEVKIKQFWSDLTSIPLENFGKTFIKSPSKGYKKNNLYYGTIKIYVPKGTDLRYRVYGWIKKVLKEINPRVEVFQKKWECLKETSRPVNL